MTDALFGDTPKPAQKEDTELLYLRSYFQIMEDQVKLLVRCRHLLQHFTDEGELIGNSRWRMDFIYQCCKDITEDADISAKLLDELALKYPYPDHLLEPE